MNVWIGKRYNGTGTGKQAKRMWKDNWDFSSGKGEGPTRTALGDRDVGRWVWAGWLNKRFGPAQYETRTAQGCKETVREGMDGRHLEPISGRVKRMGRGFMLLYCIC